MTPVSVRIVDRGSRALIVPAGVSGRVIAEVSPYAPEARAQAEALVRQANEHRRVLGALRLLFAASQMFQARASVAAWGDLRDATKVARDVLAGLDP